MCVLTVCPGNNCVTCSDGATCTACEVGYGVVGGSCTGEWCVVYYRKYVHMCVNYIFFIEDIMQ